MKSRPLRVGGVGEGIGLGRIEGASKRMEQLAESRVQPRKHTEPRHAEHGGNLLCKETHKHTASLSFFFFLSVTSQQVLAPNHTHAASKQERFTQSRTKTPSAKAATKELLIHTSMQGLLHIIKSTHAKRKISSS